MSKQRKAVMLAQGEATVARIATGVLLHREHRLRPRYELPATFVLVSLVVHSTATVTANPTSLAPEIVLMALIRAFSATALNITSSTENAGHSVENIGGEVANASLAKQDSRQRLHSEFAVRSGPMMRREFSSQGGTPTATDGFRILRSWRPSSLVQSRSATLTMQALRTSSNSSYMSGIYLPGFQIVISQVPWFKTKKCLATDGSLIFLEDCYELHRFKVPLRQRWYWSGRQLRCRGFLSCMSQPLHDSHEHGKKEALMEACEKEGTPQQSWYFDSFQRLKNNYEETSCVEATEGESKLFMSECDGSNGQWFSYK
eukprot:TRINITY_DN54570_c0_g1_i1.p1 TRINITY_DN54570_c0_g1~~TRINITY_DN54570_c0_g1_i1.p1  ORF type:complete len:316 (-),score=39.19 TRINITY_DN54570_c0_g1_i1:194-1141(-)